MNILYISHLSKNIAAGLNWSVPASVQAQSKIDDVLWVNMTDVNMTHWNHVKAYHNVTEFDGKLNSLDCLPSPFNNPDVVVFEGFYYMDDVRIGKYLRKLHIPYIIIPRGSLTNLALHNHAWLKKWVAHKLYFDEFVNHAKAIQYLTKQEADDSIDRFKIPYFIIPNGFNTPEKRKTCFSADGIKAVFIGRLDIFHKGIDLLLDAMTILHSELVKSHFFFDIFGPRRYDYYQIEKEIIDRNLTDIIAIHDEVSGKEKENVLLNSDLFVMASRFEGHPMGLIEALAYGLPTLVTPGTNMSEEIKCANAGWTSVGTKDMLAQTISSIIKEKDQFSEKGRNGILLSSNYKWDKLALRFHDSLTGLIN